MNRVVPALVVLLGLFWILRNQVFQVPAVKKLTPAVYDRPIYRNQWLLPRSDIPAGFRQVTPDPGAVSIPEIEIEDQTRHVPRDPFPTRGLKTLYALEYESDVKPRMTVLVAHYESLDARRKQIPDSASAASPITLVSDHYVARFASTDAGDVAAFKRTFIGYLDRAKQRRRNLEKVVVASNAYLKLFTNLLVGALLLSVVFYFIKTMMIRRQVEET